MTVLKLEARLVEPVQLLRAVDDHVGVTVVDLVRDIEAEAFEPLDIGAVLHVDAQ